MRIVRKREIDFLRMIAGSGIMAAAVVWFYEPQGLVTGGMTGLAIIVKHITEPLIPGGACPSEFPRLP